MEKYTVKDYRTDETIVEGVEDWDIVEKLLAENPFLIYEIEEEVTVI